MAEVGLDVEQAPEQLHWRERQLRFLRAYYQAVIYEAGIAEGEWLEFYKERLQEIEHDLSHYTEPGRPIPAEDD